MKRSLTIGTLIIIFAGLIIKVIGFATRLIISNVVGAEGLGLYQLFYPFYTLIILTVTSGITIAQSGLISSEVAKKQFNNVNKINTIALVLIFGISVIIGALIFFSAENLTFYIYNDKRLELSIKYFAPFLPLISLAAVLRGYFYGIGNIAPTGFAGIVEQLAKISVILAFAGWALKFGLEYACLIMVFGLIAGEVSNLLVMASVFFFKRKNYKSSKEGSGSLEIVKNIIKISLPVSLNRFLMSILAMIEMILIKNSLINTGIEYNYSLEEFGRLTGMVMPLILFPMVMSNAVATTLVPAISESIALKDDKGCRMRISRSLLFTIISGAIFTSVFLSYSDEMGRAIFRSNRCGDMIYLISFSCVFIYLQQIMIGILNGLSHQKILLSNIIFGFVLRYGAIFFLIPVLGIDGYIWGIIVSSIFVCLFNFRFLVKKIKINIYIGKWVIRPLFVCIILVFSSEFIFKTLELFIRDLRIITLLSCVLMILMGFLLMFLLKIIEIGELGIIKLKSKS